MSYQALILLAGLASGLLAVMIAIAFGFGWGGRIAAYILGGDLGLLMAAVMVARARGDEGLELGHR